MNEVGFRLAFRQVSLPPTDLNSTSPLVIAENQPIGTIVGEFNATDPDGDAVSYHFTNGENNNSLFTLDTNGTLKTATIFDYESNASSYTITVQAKDELNATTEGNFTVTLLDDDTEDRDGDGFTDGQEADAGSNPSASVKVVRFTGIDGLISPLVKPIISSVTTKFIPDCSTTSRVYSSKKFPVFSIVSICWQVRFHSTELHVLPTVERTPFLFHSILDDTSTDLER